MILVLILIILIRGVPSHIFDNQLLLRLVWLFLNRYQSLILVGGSKRRRLGFHLINSLLRDILLDSIERVLIGDIHASMSLSLGSLHADLDPRLVLGPI